MSFFKRTPPSPPDINHDEETYFIWLMHYDESLELFRIPFKKNLDQFAKAIARRAYDEFAPYRGNPEKIFERVQELAVAYQEKILPVLGQDGRRYLELPPQAQGIFVSVVFRMECGRHLLMHKYRHKVTIDLDTIAHSK